MNNKITTVNNSVQKIIQIIEVMAREQKPMKLQDIALRCNIPASTALRMIYTLETNGYATQNPDTLCYSLTVKFTLIGNMVKESISLYQIVHPHVERLSYRCKANVNVTVEDDFQVLYIDVVDNSESPIKISHTIGQKYPLYSTASGKIILSGFSEKKMHKYLNETQFQSFSPKTIISKQELLEEIEKVRTRGHSYNDEEGCLGMRCLAVSIRNNDGAIIAALSISGTIYQLSYEYLESLVPIIKHEAEEISKELSFSKDTTENTVDKASNQ